MTVGSINPYNNYSAYTGYYAYGMQGSPVQNSPTTAEAGDEAKVAKVIKNPGESTDKKVGRKSSPAECETCKERKYQDGSDEQVSFKSPAHISPEASAARVRAHEMEHVSNAYAKAEQGNGQVVSCSVSLKTAVCPECGRTYVAGGTTATQIRYNKNPYQQSQKSADQSALVGMNVDFGV